MDAERKESLALLVKTLLVLVGLVVLLLGATEVWVALKHPEQGASVPRGVGITVAGLLLCGIPLGSAYRDMLGYIRAQKRGRR